MSNFFDRPELKRNFFDDAPEPVRPVPAQTQQPKLTRSWGETAKDLAVGVGQGTANLLGGTAELANTLTGGLIDKGVRKAQGAVDQLVNGGEYREGPGITGAYSDLNKQLDAAKSPLLQRRNQELADTKGFFASAKKILTDPVVLSDQVAQQVPQLVSMAGTARGTLAKGAEKALAKGATREAAEDAGRKSLERQLVTYSAVQEAGPSAMQARQEIDQLPQSVWDSNEEYRSRIAAGEDPAAVKESMSNVAALKAAGVGGAAGALGGKLTAGLEGRIFTKALDHAPLLSRQGAKELASTVGKEALEETIQEGGNQLGTNVGVQGIDPTRGLMDGVPEAAGTGAALGGLIGGGLHVAGTATSPLLSRGQQPAPAQDEAPAPAQPDPLALPPPDGAPGYGTIRVTPDGTAITEPQRAGIDAQNEATGLTPDVEAARAAHPGATPNTVPLSRGPRVPFPDATPGSLSDALNATAETAAPPAQVSDPDGMDALAQRADAAPLGSLADATSIVTRASTQTTGEFGPVNSSIARPEANNTESNHDASNDARSQQDTGIQNLAERGGPVPEPEQSVAPQLRRPGNQAAPAVGAELSGVPAGSREASGTELHAGTDRQRQGLPAGQRTLGDPQGTSEQPAENAPADLSRKNPVADGVGGGTGPGAVNVAVPPESGRDVGAGSTDDTATRGADANRPSSVAAAAMEAATSPNNDLKHPSDAQLEAGNFKVGRARVNGLDISIEHPAGVKRKPEHSQALAHAYGYIRRTEGADGEKFDVFLGDRAHDTSLPVFVVDQNREDGSFDESKALMGFASESEARAAYLANYPKGWNGLGSIRQFSQDEFKAWVKDPAKTALPAAAPRSAEPGTAEPGTAEQEAPGAAIEDEIRPAGKKRERGFTSAASVTAAITERGLSLADYEVKATEQGGYIGVRKTAGAQATPAKPGAEKPPSAPAQDWRERSERADAQARKDNAAKKPPKGKAEDRAAALASYFKPGNIIKSYAGYDEVLSYRPGDASQSMRVEVHEVRKVGDEWVRVGKPQDARWHSTLPDASELKAGPIDTVPAGDATYTEPRPDGQPFPNAPRRGAQGAPIEGAEAKGKADAKQTKAAKAEQQREIYRDLLADADMVGKSEEDLATILQERGVDEKPRAKMAKELRREIQHKAEEREKEKHRDPAVLDARITDGLQSAAIEDAVGRAQFTAGFMHALAGKTKSTMTGENLGHMLTGYADAKKWMRTDEGRAYYEGKPAKKLENTGADLRRWFEQLKAEAEAAKSDGSKLWAAIKKQTVRANLFPITPAEGATPGVTRLLEYTRDQLASFADYLSERWSDNGYDVGISKDGRAKPSFTTGRRKYFGTLDERMAVFFDSLLSEKYRFKRDMDAPQDQWVPDPYAYGHAERKLPPVVPMTEAEQRDLVLGFVQDYVDGVRAWHAGLSKAKTAQEGADIAAELIADDRDRYRFLFRSRVSGQPRRYDNPMTPRDGKASWPDNLNKSHELERIINEDTIPLNEKGDRTKPLTPPRLDHITRERMPDQRGGKDVTPQEFKETFGFADVGFGTWVGAKQDQDHLNYAFDAFVDLANHFGIPAKMIGLGGKLHFTIGALGHGGKAAAHFQRAQPHPNGGTVPVINVTNTKGDGTVYHEWTHAFDLVGAKGDWPQVRAKMLDMLRFKAPTAGEIDAVARRFLLGQSFWTGAGRLDRVQSAIKALAPVEFKRFSATNTNFHTNAVKLDKGNTSKPYWSNDEEMLARSAEAWASDTLGGINTYLVNPAFVGDGRTTADTGYRGTPYPRGQERELVARLWGAVAKATTVKDGELHVSKQAFDDAVNDLIEEGEARRLFLRQPENMQAFMEEVVAEQQAEEEGRQRAAEEKKRKEQAEADRLAAEALAALDAAPLAGDAMGPLTDNDLEAIFDEAAAELRESTFEEPDAPVPGEKMLELEAAEEATSAPALSQFKPVRDYVGRQWVDENGDKRKVGSYMGGDTISVMTLGREGQVLMSAADIEASIAAGKAAREAKNETAQQAAKADMTAAKIAAEAANLGVEGLDEAMKGLVKLFGGRPGQLNSFPAGFDKDTYDAAKPHFQTALTKFQEAGKTLKDLFKFLIQQFGDGVKMYAIQFAKDEGLSSQLGSQPTASALVASWVQEKLRKGEAMDWRALFERADAAFGGTQAEGKYTPKDAYDALEAGVNGYIMANPLTFSPQNGAEGGTYAIAALTELMGKLPTQTKRTAEQDQFQQFSTVPPLAYAVNWVANVSATDTVLEPSAGIGGLAAFAQNAGAKLILNELSSRRAAVLQEVFPAAKVFRENAEQLDNILPADVVPSVVVMNPPFSASGSRGASKDTSIGARHVEQALDRLADGGRLVAIVGDGMRWDAPAFKKWWAKIGKEHNVRAVVPMSGKGYAKYGTTFDNVLLVIDKTAPAKGATPVTTAVESYNQLIGLLSEIRNDRPSASVPGSNREAVERDAALAERRNAAQAEQGAGELQDAGGDRADGVGGGKQVRGSDPGRGGAGNRGARGAAGPGSGVREPDVAGDGDGADAGGRGGVPAGESGGRDRRPDTAADSEVAVTAAEDTPAGELTESIFEGYAPQRLKVEGAKPHPGPLVQSSAMASVVPPAPTYSPKLPKATIEKGLLSIAQIEAVVYAGQAHEQFLPSGERRGFFIGDGTGVGKGREISGILLDNLLQGRKKAVWVSEKPGLLNDAKRDFKGVGGDERLIFGQSKTKATAAIPGTGILFTTYSTLRSGAKGQNKGDAASKDAAKTRLQQIVDWVGPDFDGVIAFDEAHNAGNAVAMKGKRGISKPSEQAKAVVELQKLLPKARVVYVSATGATEVSNLSFATRLGLWGEGTPFATVEKFIAQIAAGGLANMELVARDMKQMGMYLARSLSFDGVTYSRLEHELTPIQRDIYDRLCDAWQVVLKNIEAALELTGAKNADTGKAANPGAVSAARSAFWGTQQRFFNQVITAMQMPAVLEQMERDLADGKALVLQLVNTNEAAQERALAKRKDSEEEEDLEELDLTPRDALMQMVEKSFPVVQMEEEIDAEGNKKMVPVMDSEGKPVLNKKAIAMRDKLLEDLRHIKVPDGPLELILNHFGPDAVAEVTGRSRRVVRRPDADGNLRAVIEKRSGANARTEAEAFMADKRQILIFSDAGGTGYSFHADRTQKNQRKRAHYLIQPGWRANKAVQGFGRSHRTNQASAPHYYLASTNIPAHKRFLSSIARRLDQLGALTKGQRDTANQGLFNEKDNLESIYADQAIKRLLTEGLNGQVAGFMDMLEQMGLTDIVDPNTGQIAETKTPPVSKFLNRMLSLKLETQEQVFDAFLMRMEQQVEAAIERGEFDAGLQTIKAIETEVVQDEVIYTDPRTKAETHFVELKLTVPNTFYEFPSSQRFLEPEWMVNKTSGRVYLRVRTGDETLASGAIVPRYQLRGTSGNQSKKHSELFSRTNDLVGYDVIDEAKARELWEQENAARPATVTRPTYLITGAVLPIWDRLDTGGDKIEVVRTQTASGRRLLGRQIMPARVKEIRKRFDLSSAAAKMKPLDVIKAVLTGQTAELANGWKLERAKVSDEMRIELKAGYLHGAAATELERMGMIRERINWQDRYFVPVGAAGVPVLEKLFSTKPMVDLVDPETSAKFSRRDPAARDGTGQRTEQVRRAIAPIVSRWGAAAPEVVVVDSAQDLPAVVRTEQGWEGVEGWYDDRTGTVYLVAGNLTSDERARRVLAHEAVGHYGIEAIVGEAQWSQIRDTVYRMMQSGQHQALFAELARRYRGVNEPLFVREAVAVMAEKGMGGGVVNRVIAAIRRFLRGIGFDLEFSERELRDLIGKSARYLRNGRRPRVALEAGQAMAFAARPDRDWNATVPVVGIAGGTFGDTNSIRQARAAAKNYLMRLRDSGRLMTNADTGWKIGLSRASINELTQFGQEKLNLLIALPRIANVAVLADSAPNRKPAAQGESVVAYHTLYAPVALNGELRIARLVVQEQAGGRYAFDLQHSSVLNAQGPAGVARFPGIESGARRPGEAHAWTVGQLRDAVNAVDRKGWAFSHPSQDSMKDSEGVEYAHAEEALQSRLAQWAAEIHLGGSGPRAVGASPEAIGTVARNGSGAAHQGDASREEIRTQSARLIERAKAEGFFWDSDHPILARLDTLPVLGGAEHRVFVVGSGDARFVIRATDNGLFGPRSDISPAQYLARLDDFNSTFPSLQTRLIGVSESADIPGHAVIWTAQPFVYGKKFSSQDALREGMVARGWQEDGYPGVPRYRHTASGAVIEDAHIDNVFHDEDGNLYPFDVVVAEMPTSGGLKFSRPDPEKTLEAMDARTVRGSVFDALRTWWNRGPISSAVENTRPAWLGALTLRHLAELGNDIHLKQVDAYAKRVQQMTTDRNALQEAGAKVAEIWEKFQRTDRAGADATANLMHDATIAGVDPSQSYIPLMTGSTKRGENEAVTAESIARRIAMVDADLDAGPSEQARRRLVAERGELEALLAEERARRLAYPELVRRYRALPEKGREVYLAARNVYDDQSSALRDAIIARVKDSVESGGVRDAYIAQVRQTFEDARVRGPYFPLARFGEFWINAEKDGKQAFFMYENVQEWRAGQTDLARRGYVVKEAGRKIAEARSVAGVSSAFMADLEGVLKQSGADKQVMDDVWQMYLRTLPDLSIRKHFIHRKKVEGYSSDALRAFSGNVFHGSYQIARVRHSHKLVELLDSLKEATAALASDDPERAIKAAALATELGKRHEWVMNPKDSKAASRLTSLGFVWYLGMTPAAGLVNLTQTAIVTFPVLASRFGVAKAWNTLAAATGRALRNVNGDLTRGLSDEERTAFEMWEKSGAIDRTMAHNLAGLSETDTRSYNPVARRGMELVSLMFHKAEVVNREATALAAFRLARSEGQDFHTAVQYAADVITESHFDYSNANRARWMQNNVAKVLLLFRQYSLNITWLLWRNFYLGTKGETPAVRKEARKKLAGVLGMTALFAGVMGLPLMGLMFDLANAAAAAFGDDDDPFDAEVEFRNFLADLLGPDLARFITQGPVETMTGIELGSRVGLNELWLRSPDRELEGQAMADYLLEQAAGPVVGGMLVNTLRGGNMIAEGNTWRGIETMAPKAVKDGMKALRYGKEGINTMRGDPLIEDLSLGETLMQLAGFTPADVTERYDANSAAKNYEQRILGRRRALLNAYAMAWRAEDADGIQKALTKIQAWNAKHPAMGITLDTIRRSLASRMRYSARAESGVVLDRRIAEDAREQARFGL